MAKTNDTATSKVTPTGEVFVVTGNTPGNSVIKTSSDFKKIGVNLI